MHLAEPIFKMFRKASVPHIEVGDVVRVHQKIREGAKERIQVFEGIVIATHEKGSLDATFTVRKLSSGIGVEKTWLLHSPNITKVEFKRSSKIRRSKLYYLRALTGKALKMKDAGTSKEKWTELIVADEAPQEATEADIAEAVAAQKEQEEATAAEAQTEEASEAAAPAEEPVAESGNMEDKPEVTNDQQAASDETSETTDTEEEAPADSGDGADTSAGGN